MLIMGSAYRLVRHTMDESRCRGGGQGGRWSQLLGRDNAYVAWYTMTGSRSVECRRCGQPAVVTGEARVLCSIAWEGGCWQNQMALARQQPPSATHQHAHGVAAVKGRAGVAAAALWQVHLDDLAGRADSRT